MPKGIVLSVSTLAVNEEGVQENGAALRRRHLIAEEDVSLDELICGLNAQAEAARELQEEVRALASYTATAP